jgi:hypothetical protein
MPQRRAWNRFAAGLILSTGCSASPNACCATRVTDDSRTLPACLRVMNSHDGKRRRYCISCDIESFQPRHKPRQVKKRNVMQRMQRAAQRWRAPSHSGAAPWWGAQSGCGRRWRCCAVACKGGIVAWAVAGADPPLSEASAEGARHRRDTPQLPLPPLPPKCHYIVAMAMSGGGSGVGAEDPADITAPSVVMAAALRQAQRDQTT